jgi:superfamily II DNA helicase RecQ
MVMELPATVEALNSIHGLGASRIARYGQEILEQLKSRG